MKQPPKWVKKLEKAAKKIWWIGGVAWPSRTAIVNNLGNRYLAVTGDGLLSVLFEVKSFRGNGKLRFHDINKDGKAQSGMAQFFKGSKNVKHDDILTFPQAIELVMAYNDTIMKRIR